MIQVNLFHFIVLRSQRVLFVAQTKMNHVIQIWNTFSLEFSSSFGIHVEMAGIPFWIFVGFYSDGTRDAGVGVIFFERLIVQQGEWWSWYHYLFIIKCAKEYSDQCISVYNIIIDSGVDHLFWISFVSTSILYILNPKPDIWQHKCDSHTTHARSYVLFHIHTLHTPSEWARKRINMQNLSDGMTSLKKYVIGIDK